VKQEASPASASTARLNWQFKSGCFSDDISQSHDTPGSQIDWRHLGLTLRLLRSGNYRVNFRDGNETTAYYTDDLEDAVNTAVEMARKRAL
jgi:hypothetical protein